MLMGHHRYLVTSDIVWENHSLKKGTIVCDTGIKPMDERCLVISVEPEVYPYFEYPKENLEPIFCLRAQDILAPQLVREWAERAASANCPGDKVQGAKDWAEVMEKHPNRKYPD